MLRFILSVTVLVHFSMVQAQVATLTNAILYRNDGNLVQAKQEIDKACVNEKTITMSKTWFYKGIIYMELYKASPQEVKATDYTSLSQASDAFKKAISLENPPAEFSKKSQEALNEIWSLSINHGVSFYQNQSYTKAIPEFERAQTIKPTDTTAYIYAIYAASEAENKELVDRYAAKLMQLNYVNDGIYYIQINNLMDRNQLDSAMVLSNKAVAKYSDDVALKTQHTELLVKTNQTQAAIKNLTDLYNANPQDIQLLINIGVQYDILNDSENAKATYNKVLALDSTNYIANYNLSVYTINEAGVIAKKIAKNDSMHLSMNRYYVPNKDTDPLRNQLKTKLIVCKKYYTRANTYALKDGEKNNTAILLSNINSLQDQFLK